MKNIDFGTLINFETKEVIRPATCTQLSHSMHAKPLGIILVDNIRCQVIRPPAGSEGFMLAIADYGDHEDDYGSGWDA